MKGVVRALILIVAGVLGLAIGVGALAAVGLLIVQPPTITAAGPAQPWDIELTLTDAFMTARLNEGRGDQPIALRDAKAKFRADGTVEITGTAGANTSATPAAGGRLPIPQPPAGSSGAGVGVAIVLRPAVGADGKLAVDVVSAQLGPLPVPSGLGRFLDGPVNSQLGNAMQGQSFRLLSLTVADGAMTVRAKQESR